MSAPEFDGTPMTRREVLIARKAVEYALSECTYLSTDTIRALGVKRYPLPVVTRPRVVAVEDQPGLSFRIVDGVVQYNYKGRGEWSAVSVWNAPPLTPGAIAALRSLDAEPTETVTEEEG